MSMISPVQSHFHKGSPIGRRSLLRWEGFVEKVRFEPGVKEWRSDEEEDGLTSEWGGASRQDWRGCVVGDVVKEMITGTIWLSHDFFAVES